MPLDKEMRFWAKVQKAGHNDCWQWIGARRGSRQQRGCFWNGVKNVDAARWIWQHSFKQNLCAGEVVMHTCDNPLCVNPRHLVVGSIADNVADMHAKGRSHHQRDPSVQQRAIREATATMAKYPELRARGERHGKAKLTDEVRSIVASSLDQTSLLAARYGVSRTCIQRIRAAALRARSQGGE